MSMSVCQTMNFCAASPASLGTLLRGSDSPRLPCGPKAGHGLYGGTSAQPPFLGKKWVGFCPKGRVIRGKW